MPESYLRMIGGPRDGEGRLLEDLEADRRGAFDAAVRAREQALGRELTTEERVRLNTDMGPSLRQTQFDRGGEPLPAASWPPPRRTGWERPYQR
jgi:hypothetical protein